MPLRRQRPLEIKPKGCTDSLDGSAAAPGSMLALANLVPDPQTDNQFVPRPAATALTDFTHYTQFSGPFLSPGFVSGGVVIGDILYGMIADGLNPGNDRPFALNLATQEFLPVAGITAANTPASPPSTGLWTPPILAQVGTRIIVTHPGFPGGAVKFGWFDVGALDLGTKANATAGSTLLTGNPAIFGVQPGILIRGVGIPAGAEVVTTQNVTATATGNLHLGTVIEDVDVLTGVRAGMQLSSPSAFPGGTTVQATSANPNTITVADLAARPTSSEPLTLSFGQSSIGDLTVSSRVISNINVDGAMQGDAIAGSGIPTGTLVSWVNPSTGQIGLTQAATSTTVGASLRITRTVNATGSTFSASQISAQAAGNIAVGQQIAGNGIPAGAFVTGIAPNTITISAPALAQLRGVQLNFTGATITMSLPAIATRAQTGITLLGGTKQQPLWGAGDCNVNPLPSVPVGVAQFNGRAYFACGTDGIPYTDALLPCQRTNASQALTTSDGLAVTALGALPLTSLLGGVVQSIIAFEGTARMQQITGDQATNNLAMNALPVATGTNSPLSICNTNFGLAFVSPEGLRYVSFLGAVSDPVGDHGTGICQPFIQSQAVPAVASRICAAGNADTVRISLQNVSSPTQPYQEWWYDIPRKIWTGPHTFTSALLMNWRDTFVATSVGVNAKIFQSDVVPRGTSVYDENGAILQWAYITSLLPDNTQAMYEHGCNEATIALQIPPNITVSAWALNEGGQVLDEVALTEPQPQPLWGQVGWGQFEWGEGIPPGWVAGNLPAPIWGSVVWDGFHWGEGGVPSYRDTRWGQFLFGAKALFLREYPIPWSRELVFKQMFLQFNAPSQYGTAIGALRLRYQITGYMTQTAAGFDA